MAVRPDSSSSPAGSAATSGRRLGIAARTIRDDRILDEVNATGGDIRRICDLFGIGVDAAVRYVATLDHPGLVDAGPNGTKDGGENGRP